VAYDNIIQRSDVAALIPEDVSNTMLGRVRRETSAALSQFRNIPVAQSQTRFPILSALPVAYWVTGDTGLKQTTEMGWSNKYLNVEELAVIVPIPENVLDDTSFDVWGEIRPEIEVAMGRAFDAAVFFGTNAPATFPTNVSAAAASAGNTVTLDLSDMATSSGGATGGIQDTLDQALGTVELDGYDPSGIVAARSLKGYLRRARDTTGQRLDSVNGDLTEYNGMSISYPMRGMSGFGNAAGNVQAFVGDFSEEFVVGVRQDIRYKVLDQAVIQDSGGNIVYNLAQQDMVALRVTFRAGWQVSNRINFDQPTEANRYPAARVINQA
jgi:HK97 family phage major capsid protein